MGSNSRNGGFIWVTPQESEGFWLRASDVVGVKPTPDGCQLMRHATIPVEVSEPAEAVLDLLAECDGYAIQAMALAGADTD